MENVTKENGIVFLPPSPNWFCNGALDARESDRLLVLAAFKTIVILKVPTATAAPEVLKTISHFQYSKVQHVRIYPNVTHSRYQSYLLASGETGAVTLFCCDTGTVLKQHAAHAVKGDDSSMSSPSISLCFLVGEVSADENTIDDVYAVSVGPNCLLSLWKLSTNIVIQHTLTLCTNQNSRQKRPTLHLVEPVPNSKDLVMVAAEKSIFMVNAISGRVVTSFRGHDHAVYCLRWFTGEGNPFSGREENTRASAILTDCRIDANRSEYGSDSDNWRERAEPVRSTSLLPDALLHCTDPVRPGTYFASSDLGGEILVWSVEDRRYIAKTSMTQSFRKEGMNGRRPRSVSTSPHHTALAWMGSKLLANTASGELVSLKLWQSVETVRKADDTLNEDDAIKESSLTVNGVEVSSDPQIENKIAKKRATISSQLVHKEHNRVIYNIYVFGDIIVSYSQDRSLVGYCQASRKKVFSLPTVGSIPVSMAFCPHDSTWLTLGMHDNSIRMISVDSCPPYRTKVYQSGIKGKVMALKWHPVKEHLLLFGTNLGQVGIMDTNSGKLSSFSYFHQKSVYTVEWAPLLGETSQTETLFAYSLGDKDIALRNSKDLMENPVKLRQLLKNVPDDLCEFSFSENFMYLALGFNDGKILVIDSQSLVIVANIVIVRKCIQHLLWSPSSKFSALNVESLNSDKLTLNIASNDHSIFIVDLTDPLSEQSKKYKEYLTLRETNPGALLPEPVIISQSTRELSGHTMRISWLSYSPHNPNLLASASYDCTCQVWDVSIGTQLGNYRGHGCRVARVEFSPDEAGELFSVGDENFVHKWAFAKLSHKSPPSKRITHKEVKISQATFENALSESTNSQTDAAKEAKTTRQSGSVSLSGKKNQVHRSLFPLLHNATSHKRMINLLAILCMSEQCELEGRFQDTQNKKSLEDLLNDDEETKDSVTDFETLPESAIAHYDKVLSGIGKVIFETGECAVPPKHDLEVLFDFYGTPSQVSSFLKKQSSEHEAAGHSATSTMLCLWNGTLEKHIRASIADGKVTVEMLASAPQVSVELWQAASAAYARQLCATGDYLNAVSYFLNANNVAGAVDALIEGKMFREALVLVKSRLPYETEMHKRVAGTFAANASLEGNYDLSALVLASVGDLLSTARELCRRGDLYSLAVAGFIYRQTDNSLAYVTLIEALKQAGAKGVLNTMEDIIEFVPELSWFRAVIYCQKIVSATVNSSHKNVNVTVGDSMPESEILEINDCQKSIRQIPVSEIKLLWAADASLSGQGAQVLSAILEHFSTAQKPTSVTHFWFIVSVELCKLLLACDLQAANAIQHLAKIVEVVLMFRKIEVVEKLCILLPGLNSSSLANFLMQSEETSDKSISEISDTLGLDKVLERVKLSIP